MPVTFLKRSFLEWQDVHGGSSFIAAYKSHRRKLQTNTESDTPDIWYTSVPKGTFGCPKPCFKVATTIHVAVLFSIEASRAKKLTSEKGKNVLLTDDEPANLCSLQGFRAEGLEESGGTMKPV